MDISCGTDIIEINRIKDIIENKDDRFINRIFTEKEIEYCEGKNAQKYQHYSARFAAKEAAFKAVNDIVKDKNISWKNIEVLKADSGKPQINLIDIDIPQMHDISVSLSHCKEYAIANVVATFKK